MRNALSIMGLPPAKAIPVIKGGAIYCFNKCVGYFKRVNIVAFGNQLMIKLSLKQKYCMF